VENLIRTRICELRKIMKESGIEIYIIPTGDYHQSEYISDYFKEREYTLSEVHSLFILFHNIEFFDDM